VKERDYALMNRLRSNNV